MSHPPLILLVGMHRSGTSLLGSLLPALGVPMPGELIAADTHNPEGYYERADITALQEQLLIDLGRWWPSAAGADPLPGDWLEDPHTRAAAARLKRLLAAEQQRQPGPWAIKDPRTSLLLPLWIQVAAELDLPLRLVLSVRDPAEVMVSLLQRDAGPAGMTPSHAQRLWWHHNRQLLLDAGELPLLVVDYGAWFSARSRQRQLQRLARFCHGKPAATAQLAAATGLVRPGHRRSRRRRRDLPQALHPWPVHLYRQLRHLAAAGTPPSQRARLQCELASPRRALPPAPPPGPWFDAEHYRRQQTGLPSRLHPWLHYRLFGWRLGRSPHPLFEPNHYRHQAHLDGIATPGPPLCHFLQVGLHQGLSPSPLADPRWARSSPARLALWHQARLEGLHPWGQAALALCHGSQPAAIKQLQHWLQAGLSAADLKALTAADAGQFSGEALQPAPSAPLPGRARIHAPGLDLHDWQLHAWFQHLPLPPEFELAADDGAPAIHLLLGPLPQGPASHGLLALAGQPWVFTSEASAVPLLQRLGIAAQALHPGGAGQGWLQRPGDAEEACLQLGVPPAATLAERAAVLCLGSAGDAWERQLAGPIWGWPGFDAVQIHSPEHARLLASWLNACNQAGLQLVRLSPSAAELQADGWAALAPPPSPPPGWLPPQRFTPPLHPGELSAELAWRAAGAPPEDAVVTPAPSHQVLWTHQGGTPALAAVCVSLFNYAGRILTALESVRAQSLEPLELLIVDDGSSDDGPALVQRWLAQHGQRFSRVLLVQHTDNAGLAAARNTAFALATAPWCFVLDADNQLEPDAVAHCLALAAAAPLQTAVVHPLVELVIEGDPLSSQPAGSEPHALISGFSWQRAHFLERNVVDAMALVRRSAWQQVGGYDDIPGGWEDYDFWCKLIEAGWHGILCPQRLARYHSHASSMLATQTHLRLRRVSRVLQQRHPWLQLALASAHT